MTLPPEPNAVETSPYELHDQEEARKFTVESDLEHYADRAVFVARKILETVAQPMEPGSGRYLAHLGRELADAGTMIELVGSTGYCVDTAVCKIGRFLGRKSGISGDEIRAILDGLKPVLQ